MITNMGLDLAASIDSERIDLYRPEFEKWFRYAAVGTGTAEPAATDTALVAQVGDRTENTGGFGHSRTYERDTTNNVMRLTVVLHRVFDFTASYNLTEFGLFTGTSGNNCVYRNLFRSDPNDNSSTPVVISVQNGDQLQLIITFIVEMPWQATTYSFDITNIGTITGIGTFFDAANGDSASLYSFQTLWPGGIGHFGYGNLLVVPSAGQPTSRDTSVAVSIDGPIFVGAAYTSGSYMHDRTATMPTSYGNGDIYGFVVSAIPNEPQQSGGYKFILTNPTSITKANTHTLQLTFRVTWGRL